MQESHLSHGFVRVAAAMPPVKPAAVDYNTEQTFASMNAAARAGAGVTVFPELGITGYTCGDLFQQESLLRRAEEAAARLIDVTTGLAGIYVFGAPIVHGGMLFNCALIASRGMLFGIVPKSYNPNYREFYEGRWFTPWDRESVGLRYAGRETRFGTDLLFGAETGTATLTFGVEICEDLWAVTPPSSRMSVAGAQLILNLSASNELVGKAGYRRRLVRQQSARCLGAYVYASASVGESTTDTVFGGHGLIAENGQILAESERFRRDGELLTADVDLDFLVHERINSTTFSRSAAQETRSYRIIDTDTVLAPHEERELRRPLPRNPFVPAASADLEDRCREIFAIQSAGLASRLAHIGCSSVVIGLSGGLDSTLALLVTVEAFNELDLDPSGILCYTMPGFGTSGRTLGNVGKLAGALGLPLETVDIRDVSTMQLEQLNHSGRPEDTAYENVQARQRTMYLMNKANMTGGIVIGTGDLSELALGWCTYNGDHMSMYAVNAGVPKTLVKFLVNFVAESWADADTAAVLKDIVDTPISPELLPPDAAGEIAQKTEETIGPYELHDFFLYHAVRCGSSPRKVLFLTRQVFGTEYDEETLRKWLKSFYRRFFSQQFKRSCLPDGPKVGTISLSPRGDWRMPSDADVRLWLAELGE